MHQGRDENRSLEETLSRAWRALAALERRELTMLPATALDAYYPGTAGPVAGRPAAAALRIGPTGTVTP